jgi:hypothetical protein
MPYSLQQAAQAAGINRSTVLRAIKAGRISGSKTEMGDWQVEPAELHRVYPPAEARPEAGTDARIITHPPEGTQATGDAPSRTPFEEARDMLELHYRAQAAERGLSEMKATLDDVRADRDHWRSMAERLSLPAPAQATRWRWWRRRSAA